MPIGLSPSLQNINPLCPSYDHQESSNFLIRFGTSGKHLGRKIIQDLKAP